MTTNKKLTLEKMQKEANQSWFFYAIKLAESDEELKDFKQGFITGYIKALELQGYKNIPF